MVMEKLKSRSALSNFPTTTAAAGIYFLKIDLVPGKVQSIPQGLKPQIILRNLRHEQTRALILYAGRSSFSANCKVVPLQSSSSTFLGG
jgi:hypothetical protein